MFGLKFQKSHYTTMRSGRMRWLAVPDSSNLNLVVINFLRPNISVPSMFPQPSSFEKPFSSNSGQPIPLEPLVGFAQSGNPGNRTTVAGAKALVGATVLNPEKFENPFLCWMTFGMVVPKLRKVQTDLLDLSLVPSIFKEAGWELVKEISQSKDSSLGFRFWVNSNEKKFILQTFSKTKSAGPKMCVPYPIGDFNEIIETLVWSFRSKEPSVTNEIKETLALVWTRTEVENAFAEKRFFYAMTK